MAQRKRKKNISSGTGIAIGVGIGLAAAGVIWGGVSMYKKRKGKALPATNGQGQRIPIPA